MHEENLKKMRDTCEKFSFGMSSFRKVVTSQECASIKPFVRFCVCSVYTKDFGIRETATSIQRFSKSENEKKERTISRDGIIHFKNIGPLEWFTAA